jgi:RNA polymerase sigma-70 factor (sigma-E family)
VADQQEFGRFVRDRSPGLLRAAWLLTHDWHAAEDLVQNALVAAWRHWDTITRRDAPDAYVHRVLFTAFLRSRRRRWRGEIATADPPEPEPTTDSFTQSELRLPLSAALTRLPPRQRAVVVLRYFVDLTEAQTADTLGCSVGTVKSHAAKALASLRRSAELSELLTEEVCR